MELFLRKGGVQELSLLDKEAMVAGVAGVLCGLLLPLLLVEERLLQRVACEWRCLILLVVLLGEEVVAVALFV